MLESARFMPALMDFNPALFSRFREPPEPAREKRLLNPESKPGKNSSLSEYISYFDRNWYKEGLPRDWYRLRGAKSEVGFSMNLQLALLKDPSDRKNLTAWTEKTKRDLTGFKLEYLSNHLVYPCKYQIDPSAKRLESLEYGKKDITETVSDNERHGSVKKSLKEIKEFFLAPDTPDGSLAIMASPLGDTGLTTDEGKIILYPDSYFFIMQKKGSTVTNYTLKTDFTHRQTRDAILALSGKRLNPAASVEEYVRALSKIKPGGKKGIKDIKDVVGVLEGVKPGHTYKNPATRETTGWEDVYKDIQKGEELYKFNTQTTKAINDFEDYCRHVGLTKDDLQKAMAATILRMSQLFYIDQAKQTKTIKSGQWIRPEKVDIHSFGSILNAVAQRPGCAGGGSTSITSTTERLGVAGSDKFGSREFNCPSCKALNIRPLNKLLSKCQHCGSSAVSC